MFLYIILILSSFSTLYSMSNISNKSVKLYQLSTNHGPTFFNHEGNLITIESPYYCEPKNIYWWNLDNNKNVKITATNKRYGTHLASVTKHSLAFIDNDDDYGPVWGKNDKISLVDLSTQKKVTSGDKNDWISSICSLQQYVIVAATALGCTMWDSRTNPIKRTKNIGEYSLKKLFTIDDHTALIISKEYGNSIPNGNYIISILDIRNYERYPVYHTIKFAYTYDEEFKKYNTYSTFFKFIKNKLIHNGEQNNQIFIESLEKNQLQTAQVIPKFSSEQNIMVGFEEKPDSYRYYTITNKLIIHAKNSHEDNVIDFNNNSEDVIYGSDFIDINDNSFIANSQGLFKIDENSIPKQLSLTSLNNTDLILNLDK